MLPVHSEQRVVTLNPFPIKCSTHTHTQRAFSNVFDVSCWKLNTTILPFLLTILFNSSWEMPVMPLHLFLNTVPVWKFERWRQTEFVYCYAWACFSRIPYLPELCPGDSDTMNRCKVGKLVLCSPLSLFPVLVNRTQIYARARLIQTEFIWLFNVNSLSSPTSIFSLVCMCSPFKR